MIAVPIMSKLYAFFWQPNGSTLKRERREEPPGCKRDPNAPLVGCSVLFGGSLDQELREQQAATRLGYWPSEFLGRLDPLVDNRLHLS